ncbi:helix-turn-helix transcriptional regulator [Enterococcus termitis]|uniref:Transcriptional regulator n=1 Tax=Enterococcus termitis TaxID=332950 RepID=A0A1E5GIE4_9ENTE|nr:helix-turn-helix transcriptional regulator [Enterococcus termitis]OEG12496.1 transcriptional regulator [Enterococcus termitis]
MSLYSKIQELAAQKKISIAELERNLNFPNGSVRKFDKHPPGIKKLEEVADYFNVSTDFLLGRESEKTPSWATEKDILELDKMLSSNVNMSYGGENLTEEEKQRVKDVLTGIFWEKLEKQKKTQK